jgi:hypothetical protein
MTQLSQFEQLVLPVFEVHRAEWLAQARAVAWRLGEGGAQVTIDMVRAEIAPPQGCDPRVLGAVFTRKLWIKTGYIQSHRSACHGRPVAVFQRRGV